MSKLTWYHKEWKQWNDNGRPSSDIINLTILSLNNNRITQIDVSNLTKLTHSYLHNNPLSQPLYYSYNIQGIKIITYNNYRCYIATDFL